MRPIDGDALVEDLRKVYADNGWSREEIHFSLRDMELNVQCAAGEVDAVGCKYFIKNTHDRGDDSLCGLFHREVKCLVVETRRVGQWIDDNCSVCGLYVHHGDMRNYCPQCGARMQGEIYTSEKNADNRKI